MGYAAALNPDPYQPRIVEIDDAYTFVPADQPEVVAREISHFLSSTEHSAREIGWLRFAPPVAARRPDRSRIELYAPIRRDARSGMSDRELERIHAVE